MHSLIIESQKQIHWPQMNTYVNKQIEKQKEMQSLYKNFMGILFLVITKKLILLEILQKTLQQGSWGLS